jgi:hypothetical protein
MLELLPGDVLEEIFSKVGKNTRLCYAYAKSPYNAPIHQIDINHAAKDGCLGAVRWYMECGAAADNTTLMYACKSGNLELVQLLISRGCTLEYRAAKRAATNGHTNVLQWLLDNDHIAKIVYDDLCDVEADLSAAAVVHGSIVTMEWLLKERMFDVSHLSYGLLPCNIAILEWLDPQYLTWCDDDSIVSVMHGDLEMLKWAHSKGYAIGENVAELAACNGRLDCLVWLVENVECNITSIIYGSIEGSKVDCLAMCIDKGYITDHTQCFYMCVNNGSHKCAQLLISRGCKPQDPGIFECAVSYGEIKMLQLLKDAGCPIDYQRCIDIYHQEFDGEQYEQYIDILEWLQANA